MPNLENLKKRAKTLVKQHHAGHFPVATRLRRSLPPVPSPSPVKALFLELRARGVDLAQTLTEQPWGASDFIVRDPDGNLLCFASDVDAPG